MIHKFKLNGFNIVLDVNSGGVHVVDELTYDLLDNVQPPFAPECPQEVVSKLTRFYAPEDIRSCYAEILELYKDKILFSEDDYEKFAKYSVAAPVKAMCLHIAHDCNLRCEYCFASTGDFGKGRKLMPLEIGKKAIDFLLEQSGDRETLELDFFGGEPLMNFDVVKEVVKYARSKEQEYGKRFRFTITTNGMLLTDDKIDFINKEMSNVVLSLDGRREVNDVWTVPAATTGSCLRSRSWWHSVGIRITMCGAPLPSTIWISPMMCSACMMQALTRSPWSRWSVILQSPML